MALERLFDKFWMGDKLCLSSYAYDSTTARVQHFGDAYLACVVPDPEAPVHLLAKDTDARLNDVERSLRAEQKGGWAGHALYAKEPLLSENAAVVGDAVVFFASGGKNALVSGTRIAAASNTLTPELASWPVTARVVATDPGPPPRWYVRDDSAPPVLHRVRFECAGTPVTCAALEERSFSAPAGMPDLTEEVKLWDCPSGIVAGHQGSCEVHDAPPRVRDPIALVTRDMAAVDSPSVDRAPANCGDAWVVTTKGWTWLVARHDGSEWTAPANGLAGCKDGRAITIRGGRVDSFVLAWQAGSHATIALR
jgi:hypothetical protein